MCLDWSNWAVTSGAERRPYCSLHRTPVIRFTAPRLAKPCPALLLAQRLFQ